jgi:hypothetical protein
MKRTIALILCGLVLGCTSPTPAPAPEEPSLPDDLAVSRAVLNYEWSKRTSETNDGIEGFYLAAANMDFPDSFYGLFKDNQPPVHKFSELPLPFDELKQTLWSAYWVWSVDAPTRIDADTFQVRGGYQCGGACVAFCDYKVVRHGGREWTVDQVGTCGSAETH